ncbi:unnamed protein product [Linum tenue]|uniref:AB hydrolase-1 domain-containing protein n=1 Tax=Linum tenue TaxID=586396 RepID=A0AAV0PJ83_9ROSI|nr:unnamed protein product [Linum tenue]
MDPKLDLLLRSFTFYISSILSIIRFFLASFHRFKQIPSAFALSDACISLYFRLCGLSPVSIDVDDTTTLHFWATAGRNFRPSLVMIHGKCGDSRWQFMYQQVGHLSRRFDLYIPDLLFFGKSYTARKERSEVFQAECLAEGLRRLGVDRFSIYGISYGGYVGYHLADMIPDRVDKVVLMSTGVGCNDDQKDKLVAKLGRDPKLLLVPRTTEDLRQLMLKSVYRSGYMKLVPDSFLQDYVNVRGFFNFASSLFLRRNWSQEGEDGAGGSLVGQELWCRKKPSCSDSGDASDMGQQGLCVSNESGLPVAEAFGIKSKSGNSQRSRACSEYGRS